MSTLYVSNKNTKIFLKIEYTIILVYKIKPKNMYTLYLYLNNIK